MRGWSRHTVYVVQVTDSLDVGSVNISFPNTKQHTRPHAFRDVLRLCLQTETLSSARTWVGLWKVSSPIRKASYCEATSPSPLRSPHPTASTASCVVSLSFDIVEGDGGITKANAVAMISRAVHTTGSTATRVLTEDMRPFQCLWASPLCGTCGCCGVTFPGDLEFKKISKLFDSAETVVRTSNVQQSSSRVYLFLLACFAPFPLSGLFVPSLREAQATPTGWPPHGCLRRPCLTQRHTGYRQGYRQGYPSESSSCRRLNLIKIRATGTDDGHKIVRASN